MSARYRNHYCTVSGCDDWASLAVDLLPICQRHAWELACMFTEQIYWRETQRCYSERKRRIERTETQRGNREGSVVYYARIGDYIKIGYTTRLRNRLRTLRADELLAFEPGGADLEAQRHRDFSHERIDLRRENFRPSDRLAAHVEQVRSEHGLPHWASLPRTSEITTTERETA